MAKIRIIADRRKEADGTMPLYLRISHAGTERLVSLDLRVRVRDWNEKDRVVRKSAPDFARINARLDHVTAEAQSVVTELITSGSPVSADTIKEGLLRRINFSAQEREDFLSYIRSDLSEREQSGKYGTALNHGTMVHKLQVFHRQRYKTDTVPFSALTPSYIEAFMRWLPGYNPRRPGRKVAANTVHKNMRTLRTYVRMAVRDKLIEDNPFTYITLARERVRKDALTADEITRIRLLDLAPGSPIWHARNAWLVSLYCYGMRWQDVAHLTWSATAHGRVTYQMRKSRDPQSIRIIGPLAEVLARYEDRRGRSAYVFPYMDSVECLDDDKARYNKLKSHNARVNALLKDIARLAGIEKRLSTHVARHSFSNAAREGGWQPHEIQKALGHESFRTTEAYLRDLSDDELDARNEALF